MAINVSEALDFDTAIRVSLENNSGGGWIDGKYVAGTKVLTKALASPQQPTPKQLEFLEGGERRKDLKAFYLNKEVILSYDDSNSTVIIQSGKRYKVVFAGDWETFGWFFAIGAREK